MIQYTAYAGRYGGRQANTYRSRLVAESRGVGKMAITSTSVTGK